MRQSGLKIDRKKTGKNCHQATYYSLSSQEAQAQTSTYQASPCSLREENKKERIERERRGGQKREGQREERRGERRERDNCYIGIGY